MTNQMAAKHMRSHHAALSDRLHRLTKDLRETDPQRAEFPHQVMRLVEYVKREIMPHAQAEEATIYQRVQAEAPWIVFVESMVYEHEVLKTLYDQLQNIRSGIESLLIAEDLDCLFRLHAEKENRFIINQLETRSDIALAEILGSFRSQ